MYWSIHFSIFNLKKKKETDGNFLTKVKPTLIFYSLHYLGLGMWLGKGKQRLFITFPQWRWQTVTVQKIKRWGRVSHMDLKHGAIQQEIKKQHMHPYTPSPHSIQIKSQNTWVDLYIQWHILPEYLGFITNTRIQMLFTESRVHTEELSYLTL